MKGKFMRKLFVMMILAFGFVVGSFVGTKTTSVEASEVKTIYLHELLPYLAGEDDFKEKINSQYSDTGEYGDERDFIAYEYYLMNGDTETCFNTYRYHNTLKYYGHDYNIVEVEHDTVYSYKIKEKHLEYIDTTKGFFGNKIYNYTMTEGQTYIGEDLVKVLLYRNVDLTVNSDAVIGNKPTVSVSGHYANSDNTYNVVIGEDVYIAPEKIDGYDIYINDVLLEKDSYKIENIDNDHSLNIEYKKSTDNTITLDEQTIKAVKSGAIDLTINGEKFDNNEYKLTVDKDSELEIIATPNANSLVAAITCGNATLTNNGNYPTYKSVFTTGEGKDYIVSVDVIDASNTVLYDGDCNVEIVGQKNLTIPRDYDTKIIVKAVDGEYIVHCSLDGVDNEGIKYVDGKAEITFKSGVAQTYELNVTTAPLFIAADNDTEVNIYDIIQMHEGDLDKRTEVYETIFNNVFINNANIVLDDKIKFQYYAGTTEVVLTFNNIPLIGTIEIPFTIDFYNSIDTSNPLTADEFRNTVFEYVRNIDLGFHVSDETILAVIKNISDESAKQSILALKKFGSQESEIIRLVYEGNDRYPAVKVTGNIKGSDLRKEVSLDINQEVTVTYGNYTMDQIRELILADRKGVMFEGVELSDYTAKLDFVGDMVNKDVGEYKVSVVHYEDNEYKTLVQEVKVIVEKAKVDVNVANNIAKHTTVNGGLINKDSIVSITPNVLMQDARVDNIYFVMGLDVVNNELIARIDLSNIKNSLDQTAKDLFDGVVSSILKSVDKDGDGLTLVEFVDFSLKLSNLMGIAGLDSDVSYLDKVTELLSKADEEIHIRIIIVNDGSDITPQELGIYFVGVVTTDSNYKMAADAGYLIITPDLLNVEFVHDEEVNNLRKFKYDGTPKAMIAEAYNGDDKVLTGNIKYYYLGIQLDGYFYASQSAPINAGSYSVYAIFTDVAEGQIPNQIGVGIGGMVIMPSDNAEVVANSVTVCYDGQQHSVDYIAEEDFEYVVITYTESSVNITVPNSWKINLNEIKNLSSEDIDNLYEVIARYLSEDALNSIKTNIQKIIDSCNNIGITINDSLPVNIGEYHSIIIAINPNYIPVYAESTLIIKDHNAQYFNGKDATCTEFGWNEYFVCLDCGYSSYIEIDAFGHTAEVIPAVESTCTETGLTEGTKCSECGEILESQEIVAKKEHTTVVMPSVTATCYATGLTEGAYCSECDQVLVSPEVIDKVSHTASNWILETSATCTTKGSEHKVCTVCAEELETRDIAKVAHTAEVIPAVESTCTEEGLTEGAKCSECGEILESQEIVAKKAHTTVVIPSVTATCYATGLTEGAYCSECEQVLVAQEVTDKVAHTASNWIIETSATCTTKGLEHKVCTVCAEELETREIAKVAHTAEVIPAVESTCTETGLTEGTKCSECGEILEAQEIVEKKAHTTVVIPSVTATCYATGLTEGAYCSECEQVLVAQEVTNKVAHTASNWILETSATCTTKGLEHKVCTVCAEELETREIDELAHLFNDWTVTLVATATTDGRYERTCSQCQYTEYKTIPAYGNKEVAKVEVSDNVNGKVEVSTDSITEAIKEIVETGEDKVVISASNTSEVVTNIAMSTTSLQQVVDAECELTIETTNIHATFDKSALNAIMSSANGENIEFNLKTIEQNQLNDTQKNSLKESNVVAVLSAEILCGNTTISNFGSGKVELRIPFTVEEGKNANNYKIVYIADDGSMEDVATKYENGQLVVELEHFSEYVIVEVSNNTTNNNVALIVIISIISAFALLGTIGAIVFTRKERKK